MNKAISGYCFTDSVYLLVLIGYILQGNKSSEISTYAGQVVHFCDSLRINSL